MSSSEDNDNATNPNGNTEDVRSLTSDDGPINKLQRTRTMESAADFFFSSVPDADKVDLKKPYFYNLKKDVVMPSSPGNIENYQIDWLGPDDPEMPINWSWGRKHKALSMCAIGAMVTVFGSAIIAPAAEVIEEVFHVGLPVSILNVSLYVLGFAIGPVIWGPSSEFLGRRLPQVVGCLGLTLFSFACATAKDFQTLVLCRFFSGLFGASPLAVGPAVMADIFSTEDRGNAISLICLMIIAGPMLAPVVGGYITFSYLGWRWTEYILGIFSSLVLFLLTFFLEETYPPRLLAYRAQKIRRETGNWVISAPIEDMELEISTIVEKTLLKPLRMLVVEPILLLLSLYHGLIYGILYLCLECIPIIFGNYGWHGGNIFLPYLAMLVGTILIIITNVFVFEKIFLKRLAASPFPVLPEERLPLMMLSGICFPIGIFLLCWSGAYKVMWFVPCVGCAFFGFGLIGIFMSVFNYIIDTYLLNAASGIAANTFLRSGFGCAFPLFAHPMFINLGTQWAGTLLGCLAAILAPVPFLFYIYGRKLRQKSKFAFAIDAQAPPSAAAAKEEGEEQDA
ncbi:Tpo1 protein [Starmerella bacillaris]|uniref:Tpo1 protein n=1 Tax=Starmerella bacillaris TaxID=1247836 RepID=A0AAV5RRH6_STABA|nr:Tpo1 protein [Starmerella bacillaris]